MSRAFLWEGPYEVHPGETLAELIQELGISQAELARRTGRPTKTINGVVKGSIGITPETAIQLERVLGPPASFWNALERNYREAVARREERQRLKQHLNWMKQFPVSAMTRYGWIQRKSDRVEQLQELLNFLGAASPESWDGHWGERSVWFRGADGTSACQPAVAAWLRKGFLDALEIPCKRFSADSFRKALQTARELTLETSGDFIQELQSVCAEAGVAVVLVRELPKCKVSGATRWVSAEKAVIQLSLRYKVNDQLWFSFFHEAAHVLQEQKRSIFIDELLSKTVTSSLDDLEKRANSFAAEFLVPREHLRSFMATGDKTKAGVSAFAGRLGIAPGIVVGRLQHEGYLPFNWMNDLKVYYRWKN